MSKALEAALDVMMDTVGVPAADREITRAHFRMDLKQIIRAFSGNMSAEEAAECAGEIEASCYGGGNCTNQWRANPDQVQAAISKALE